jgi:hypothetical protein
MRKCKCGNDVANNAGACPKCGHRFTSSINKAVAGFFVICIVIAMIAVVSNSGDSTPATQRTQPSTQPASRHTAVRRIASTGNKAHDRLAALPAPEQAANLGQVVGEGCAGKRVFYMGSSPSDRSAFWSVGCKNGNSYLVQKMRMRREALKFWSAASII